MLKFYTAGESHGKGLIGFLEGFPAGLEIDRKLIDRQLYRRQLGYGRGGRMAIENDQVEILSGVRHGRTLGSPISFLIANRDWENWCIPMSCDPVPDDADLRNVTRPRPGHADLPGALKYQTRDMRDILERASARETAARTAGGTFARILTEYFGVRIASHVLAVGGERVAAAYESLPFDGIAAAENEHNGAYLRCADREAALRMIELIDEAERAGDTLGGVVEIAAAGVPPGLGSHVQWDRRLDGRLAGAMMSIPSVKAVEIGDGVAGAKKSGSQVHDAISYDAAARRFHHETNRAGGMEGGVSNGEEVRVRIYLKPIPTLRRPLVSVDICSKQTFDAAVERGDVCAVPAAGVVGEAMLALELCGAFLEKFGGDSMDETAENYGRFMERLRKY
ncbi:MAG: chorismate synthase [Acidobacteria bacterium]|nr:chorismate synthase [Acidobacteriota bacterium]